MDFWKSCLSKSLMLKLIPIIDDANMIGIYMKIYFRHTFILIMVSFVSIIFIPSVSAIQVYKKEGQELVLRDVPISQVFTPQVMITAAAYTSPVTLSSAILGSCIGGLAALLIQGGNAVNAAASNSMGFYAMGYGISIGATSPETLAVYHAVNSGIATGCSLGAVFGTAFGAFSIGFIFCHMIQRYGLDEAIRRFTHPGCGD